MSARVGSLFSGYGGLDAGVIGALGGTVAWHCEVDPGACKILAHHWPDIPNLGDITAVDWATVEPVDVLTGGFPCQDVSSAGLRKGLKPGTRSGLWTYFAQAIDALRPALVAIENVRGLLSAEAHCDLERQCWCVGDEREPALRALGAVLGDLADIGYDARWAGVRASDVGAPHQRFRVFIAAYPHGATGREWGQPASGQEEGRGARADACGSDGAPAADAASPGWEGPGQAGRARRGGAADGGQGAVTLLPTPLGAEGGSNRRSGEALALGIRQKSLNDLPRMLPTPTSADSASGGGYNGQTNVTLTDATVRGRVDFGDYTPAVQRWADILDRPAPAPTHNGRLSARFVEFMMGLPPGHVTGVPGLSHANQLKALGNGVVPQQAAHALRVLGVTA